MRKRRYRKDKEDWIVVHREELRIVPDDLWDAAQANRRENTRADFGHGPKRASYPLTGLFVCGECGNNVGGHWQQNADGTNRYHYYRCRGAMNGGGLCGNRAKVRGKELEAALIQKIEADLLPDGAVDEIAVAIVAHQEAAANSVKGEDVEQQIAELSVAIERLADLAARCPDVVEVAERMKQKNTQRSALQARLGSAVQPRAKPSLEKLKAEVAARRGKTIEMLESAADVAQLRRQFQATIKEVRLDPDGSVHVRWRQKQVEELLGVTGMSGMGEEGTHFPHFGHLLAGLLDWHEVHVHGQAIGTASMAVTGFSGFSTVVQAQAGQEKCPTGVQQEHVLAELQPVTVGFFGFAVVPPPPEQIIGFSGFSSGFSAPSAAEKVSGFSGAA